MEKTAQYWIEKLKLEPHPEGGYFREMYRSPELLTNLPTRYTGLRCFSTSIYFLLKGSQYSAFHRIRSDETWHFYSGCPVKIFILGESEKPASIILGPGKEGSDPVFQYTVIGGKWFAAKPADAEGYSLIGCTVAPGFDFNDFELGEFNKLSEMFPGQIEILKEYCIR